jgi:hypothetical protein
MATDVQDRYPNLEARPGSNDRQLFPKGRRTRAEVMYHAVHGPEPRTPEEVARDFEVPRGRSSTPSITSSGIRR